MKRTAEIITINSIDQIPSLEEIRKIHKPLPVNTYENYGDGEQINDKMLSLGKFERINSNFENHFCIVVTDREKVEIKEYKPE